MVSVSSVFNVKISPAGRVPKAARGLPITLDINGTFEDATVADIKHALAEKYPKFYVDRQKLALVGDKKTLADETKLKDLGLSEDKAELTVKDLGPQISWKSVFLIEYAGPLVFHPIVYNFPKLFYGKEVQHSDLQNYLYTFVLLHFLKRELETLFVHRFSHATMPFRNVFKNSAHYHILSGIALAYGLYGPKYSAPAVQGTFRDDSRLLLVGTIVWAWAEFSNLATHITLRNLRPAGTKTRAIPNGYGFDLVSCPNYFFETIAWTVVAVMSGSLFAWVFLSVSTGQMAIWALKKHRAYKKEFGTQYPKRKVMFPFIW